MRRAGFFGHHPPRDKEDHLASRKCRRESTPQTHQQRRHHPITSNRNRRRRGLQLGHDPAHHRLPPAPMDKDGDRASLKSERESTPQTGLNAVVEPGCCRTPPPSSRRAASTIIGAGPPRAREWAANMVNAALNAVVEPGCCRTPPPSSRRAASTIIGAGPPRAREWAANMVNAAQTRRLSIRAVGAVDHVPPQRPHRPSLRSPELHRRPDKEHHRASWKIERERERKRRRRPLPAPLQAGRREADPRAQTRRPAPPSCGKLNSLTRVRVPRSCCAGKMPLVTHFFRYMYTLT